MKLKVKMKGSGVIKIIEANIVSLTDDFDFECNLPTGFLCFVGDHKLFYSNDEDLINKESKTYKAVMDCLYDYGKADLSEHEFGLYTIY